MICILKIIDAFFPKYNIFFKQLLFAFQKGTSFWIYFYIINVYIYIKKYIFYAKHFFLYIFLKCTSFKKKLLQILKTMYIYFIF